MTPYDDPTLFVAHAVLRAQPAPSSCSHIALSVVAVC
jgi:hypothetical protein